MTNKICSNGVTNQRNCSSCKVLNQKLKQIDFALVDTVLYLDAYPECSKALAHYHMLLQQKDEIVRTINEKCGPITNLDNTSTECWQWVNGPWPWQSEAN